MTSHIKDFVSTCMVCKQYGTQQPKEPMVCRSVPKRPWQHVAVDLFSHADKSYILLVDYFSDFFEIEKINSTSAEEIIGRLEAQFARYGIPECVRSDGGPQFSTQQFAEFAEKWRFKHEVSSPHHSQSNGKAESAVKAAKKIMKKCSTAKEDVYLALLEHRNTPSADIDLSPAQRLMGRRARTQIPLAEDRPALQTVTWDTVRKRLKQRMERERQVYNKETHELPRLDEGDTVWIQPFGMGSDRWAPGIVEGRDGERFYVVRVNHGTLRRKRVHLRKQETTNTSSGAAESSSTEENEFVLRNRRIYKKGRMWWSAANRMTKHAWQSYVAHAWGFNELKPVSRAGHQPSVLGTLPLGATIVDSMDTLYIMGLKDEFNKARSYVANELDFSG
ncbi:uncharacterized protein DEA37_0012518, partial [Paragonimus westermani]